MVRSLIVSCLRAHAAGPRRSSKTAVGVQGLACTRVRAWPSLHLFVSIALDVNALRALRGLGLRLFNYLKLRETLETVPM